MESQVAPGGPNGQKVGPPVDFGLAVLILRVLEAWELGKGGLYRKYRSYKKIKKKIVILCWSRESEKPIFTIFPEIFTRKIRNTGISSETTIPGISSEATETRESRVRPRGPLGKPLSSVKIPSHPS